MKQAMFGAGCFWGVQAQFDELKGVTKTEVGYAGGTVESPSYEQVCKGKTGHAEVVHIEFDERKISYQKLINAFFKMHDATQLDRQGPDVGSQYRSVIFYYDDDQRDIAQKKIVSMLAGGTKAATQLVKATTFFKAEEYHQKYLKKRGSGPMCH